MTMQAYAYNDQDNFWGRKGSPEVVDSDGSEVESQIYEIIRATANLNSLADELERSITDLPSEFHFSRSRHCLLRPLGIKPGEKVLELGCGCGALTRYLGEIGADVVAVDDSEIRAKATGIRCKDLNNVRVVFDNLVQFDIAEKFDWVLFIGVQDYLRLPGCLDYSLSDCLKQLNKFLTSTGNLVIVAENQLGLKQLNATTDDYIYCDSYGRSELIKLLNESGFKELTFYYPFPNYKFPNVIFTDAALHHPFFVAEDMLERSAIIKNSNSQIKCLSEELAWQAIGKNGLIGELANYFLIVCNCSVKPQVETGQPFAWRYAVYRKPQYCAETTFFQDEHGDIKVDKHRIAKDFVTEGEGSGMHINHELGVADYLLGTLYAQRIYAAMNSSANIDDLAQLFKSWLKLIFERSSLIDAMNPKKISSWEVSGDVIDAAPFNLIDVEGKLFFIDGEWKVKGMVPLAWVIVRCCYNTLWRKQSHISLANYTYKDVMRAICAMFDLEVDESDFKAAINLEGQLFSALVSDCCPYDENTFNGTLGYTAPTTEERLLQLKNDEIAKLNQLLEVMTGTISWRITKPLRWLRSVFKFNRYIS